MPPRRRHTRRGSCRCLLHGAVSRRRGRHTAIHRRGRVVCRLDRPPRCARRYGRSHAVMRFHGERLDELRMRLETEVWQPLPLQRGWRMTQITEARPARRGPRLRVYSLLASLSAAADADGATLGTAVGGAPMHEQWPAAFPPGYGAAAVPQPSTPGSSRCAWSRARATGWGCRGGR